MPMSSPVRRSPRRALSSLLAAAVLAGGAGGLTAGPADARSLKELRGKLDAESKKLGSASGAMVVDLTNGRTLFSRRADKALSPASNEKLFTTATALLQFGDDGTFRTEARIGADSEISDGGVLDGDLYLVGDGDPSLNDVQLKALAAAIVKKGRLKAIRGVVGDESVFDRRRGSFDSGFAPDDDLGGQLGGLTWGHGRASPGGPATVAAARLEYFLEQLKVKVSKDPRTGRLDDAPGGAGDTLGVAVSPPMKTLAAITNQPSDNFYAETLLKDLGAHSGAGGTTAAGVKVVETQLKLLGLEPTVVDGSGLSRKDRATPREIVTLLRSMSKSEVSESFIGSLAVPGKIGTLAGRMRGTAASGRCQAKTGTLRGVSALSGYCRTVTNRIVAFSFLENDMDASAAKAVEDRMVPAIVSYKP
jgi:D-alanyl-D-alanine carboxypeptidase/D-alanyl-D-alanine-endopeptidase (penicillin-binding protein 4)